MPSKKDKDTDDHPAVPMATEPFEVTIEKDERESEEIDIARSEINVATEKLGAASYHVFESAPGKCTIRLENSAPEAVTFQVKRINVEPNDETGGKTEDVHRKPMTL